MTLKELRTHLKRNKTRDIHWLDPWGEQCIPLTKVLETGLWKKISRGKIIHVEKHLVVVEHETSMDGEGDYTALHPGVITKVVRP